MQTTITGTLNTKLIKVVLAEASKIEDLTLKNVQPSSENSWKRFFEENILLKRFYLSLQTPDDHVTFFNSHIAFVESKILEEVSLEGRSVTVVEQHNISEVGFEYK